MRVTHNFKRYMILAACCTAISVVPAAADNLANYFGTYTTSGLGNQTLTYQPGSNLFTSGDLQFQFTGLTITPTCTDTVTSAQVVCAYGSYNPTHATDLNILSTLGINGYAGFDVTGEMDVNSYMSGADQIDVKEDINLNYTVSTISGNSNISDAHLD